MLREAVEGIQRDVLAASLDLTQVGTDDSDSDSGLLLRLPRTPTQLAQASTDPAEFSRFNRHGVYYSRHSECLL